MSEYELVLPEDFPEYEYEYEAKGYLAGARLVRGGEHADIVFYEPIRLSQDIADELADGGYLACPNIVVIPTITQEAITRAVDSLAEGGFTEIVFRRSSGG